MNLTMMILLHDLHDLHDLRARHGGGPNAPRPADPTPEGGEGEPVGDDEPAGDDDEDEGADGRGPDQSAR